jgi:uncharacterized membrane protein
MIGAASLCIAVILVFTADFVYARVAAAPPDAQLVQADAGIVHIPIAEVNDNKLHFFSVTMDGTVMRFIVIRKPDGWGTALDACRICGRAGYRQDGQNVICRNCGSAIYVPTIGQAGGCNPVGFPSHVEGGTLVIQLTALQQATAELPH